MARTGRSSGTCSHPYTRTSSVSPRARRVPPALPPPAPLPPPSPAALVPLHVRAPHLLHTRPPPRCHRPVLPERAGPHRSAVDKNRPRPRAPAAPRRRACTAQPARSPAPPTSQPVAHSFPCSRKRPPYRPQRLHRRGRSARVASALRQGPATTDLPPRRTRTPTPDTLAPVGFRPRSRAPNNVPSPSPIDGVALAGAPAQRTMETHSLASGGPPATTPARAPVASGSASPSRSAHAALRACPSAPRVPAPRARAARDPGRGPLLAASFARTTSPGSSPTPRARTPTTCAHAAHQSTPRRAMGRVGLENTLLWGQAGPPPPAAFASGALPTPPRTGQRHRPRTATSSRPHHRHSPRASSTPTTPPAATPPHTTHTAPPPAHRPGGFPAATRRFPPTAGAPPRPAAARVGDSQETHLPAGRTRTAPSHAAHASPVDPPPPPLPKSPARR